MSTDDQTPHTKLTQALEGFVGKTVTPELKIDAGAVIGRYLRDRLNERNRAPDDDKEQLKAAVESRGLTLDLEVYDDQSDDPDEQEGVLLWTGVVELDEDCSLDFCGYEGRIDVQLCLGCSARSLPINTVAEITALIDLLHNK